ncbi:MAG TPA: hypothetical protein VFB22_05075 [Candidatus Baltobacteraceae bacterium]|nr:hypothetical protein [Candidatus Baltobacteraceae bacterium]
MIRRLIAALAASVLFFATPAASIGATHHATQSSSLAMFDTEAAAHAHCPRDTVVWLNTNAGIYHEKGTRSYGRTKHGAHVCRCEANAAGDRDTRNAQ